MINGVFLVAFIINKKILIEKPKPLTETRAVKIQQELSTVVIITIVI